MALVSAGVVLALAATATATVPDRLWKVCQSGAAAGNCSVPRGVAADPSTGRVFIADQGNRRIDELTAWGEFVKAWGWDVVASGPGDDTSPPEDQFEVCVPENGDQCKVGLAGDGAGQFGSVFGVSLDSAGAVYAMDSTNHRIQKFSPAGEFLLMFGGEVNQTKVEELGSTEAERNRCPVDPGDVCKAGSTGAGMGQFEAWAEGDVIEIDKKGTPSAGDDVVYVGDKGRVQKFDVEGAYLGDLPDPDSVLTGKVQSLAVDQANGSLFVAIENKENAWKLGSAGGKECELKVERPGAIAPDNQGRVWVVSARQGGTPPIEMKLVRFDAGSCAEQERFDGLEEGFVKSSSTGLATNLCPGSDPPGNLYITNASGPGAFIRAYGTPPVGCEEPPKKPPEISAQYAISAGPQDASVRAEISPHFMNDAHFQVEYGTGECATGGCPLQAPAGEDLALGGGITQDFVRTLSVQLTGLSPGTTYHYRFAAESEGGGPEFGPRPKGPEGAEGEATFADGLEATFKTPAPLQPQSNCPNQGFRTGPSAFLPDCRAFEMVSPVDKNGGSIETLATTASGNIAAAHDQSAGDGNGITYSAKQAFGDALGGPYSSQYVSSRDPGKGWSTHSVNAPHEGFPGGIDTTLLDAEYKHFSEDLSQAWLVHAANPPLAPCGPQDSAALYRRLNTSDTYEALHCASNGKYRAVGIELLGASDDGCEAAFRADGKLTEEAQEAGTYQVYLSSCEAPPGPDGPVRLASILPDGERCKAASTAGSISSDNKDGRSKPVWHALSADGERLYWSCGTSLYLREHPDQPQSAMALGSASGTGKLEKGSPTVTKLLAAKGTGDLTLGSDEVSAVKTTVGRFVVGQPIAPVAGKIAAGTTIVEVGAGTLKLSSAALATATGVNLTSEGPQPFAAGQTITGQGIPAGTTIEAAGPGTLTLSANATLDLGAGKLEASSECSEAQKACSHLIAEASNVLGCLEPRFQSASPDGARMLFIDCEAGVSEPNRYVLRRFDATSGATTTIAGGLQGFDSESTSLKRIDLMGASEDLTRAYLVSNEVLTEEPNSVGEKAVAGKANLFLYREGAGFSFIGVLNADDLRTSPLIPSPLHPERFRRASRVSPDGLHAAFISTAPLTGFDTADAESGEADAEVYVYDATANGGAGKLLCASCNASGVRPMGEDILDAVTLWAAAWIPGWQSQLYQGRPLSADGRRLFFNSFEALVDRDTNNRQDVYEWEQVDGTGKAGQEECEALGAELFNEEASGCISLISSGHDPLDSELVDAGKDGSDVFFKTGESLLVQDPGLVDIYDARIGGGFPPPPAFKPPCEGEACQSPPAPPAFGAPASSAAGPTDPPVRKPKPCPKGKRKVRKGGKTRCVPRKPHKQQRRAHSRAGGSTR